MVKVIKRKRLYEDDMLNNQQLQTTLNQQLNNTLNQNTTNNLVQLPTNLNQLLNNQLNLQNQQNTNLNQQLLNQLNQQNLQQPQNLQNNNQQNNVDVAKILELVKHVSDIYWTTSHDVPQEILAVLPDFKKENENAKPAISAWDAFKQNSNETTYKSFIEAFNNYIQALLNNNQLNNNQQGINQQLNGQPTMLQEKLKAAFNFRKALQENLLTAYKKDYYNSLVNNYFYNQK